MKTINSIMHNIKRVREEKTNTMIFMWFGNPRLRPCLQAHRAWGFHYPSLPRFQTLTIDFQSVNEPLQQEIIPNLLFQVYPNIYNLLIWFYKNDYKTFSHTMYLNTNESSICVNKWNKYKVYALRFAEKCSKYQLLHHLKWIGFEFM